MHARVRIRLGSLAAWAAAAIVSAVTLDARAEAPAEMRSSAAPPDASPDAEIALAPLMLEGDEDATWRSRLSDALGRGLRRAGIDPVALPEGDAPCDALCWAERARSANHALVVHARVIAKARLYQIELEARDATDGAVVSSSTQPCRPCGRAEVESQLERQAAALGDRLVRLDLAPALLVVDSRPSGAEVTIDGVVVGTTPLEVPMPSGSHRLEARLTGHEPRARDVTAVRGVTERWTVTLPTIAASMRPSLPRDRPRDPLWPTGWALTGVGVPALAVGIAFLAIDERPYRARCSGADYDPTRDLCRYRWRSLVPGAVLTAVGSAMTITGVTLAGLSHRRRVRARAASSPQHPPRVRAVGTFDATGGGVAIVGRF